MRTSKEDWLSEHSRILRYFVDHGISKQFLVMHYIGYSHPEYLWHLIEKKKDQLQILAPTYLSVQYDITIVQLFCGDFCCIIKLGITRLKIECLKEIIKNGQTYQKE